EKVFKLRWLVLFIMGLVIFGSYYAYDAISPIADFIMKGLNISRAQYGLFFSVYSLPNFIMVLLGGILLDIIGIRKAGILFAALCAAGVFLTAAGPTFLIMLAGRFLYGLGSESLIITMDKIISKWFRGKELSLAFGLNITIARLGTFAALNSAARIQAWSGSWRLAIWISAIIMFVSFALFLVYAGIDKAKEKYLTEEKEKTEKFVFEDVYRFRAPYWYVSLLCMTFYSAIFPFTAFSTVFLQSKFGLTAVQGGFYTSLVITGSMIFTPLFGLLVDKIGKRATLMIVGSLMLIPTHLTLGLTYIHPAIPMIVLGISFSLVPAALWPSIPIMIEEKRLGTAFGLMTLIQNIGLTIFPWLAGKITDLSGGDYTNTMLMFASLGFIGAIFSILLKISDSKAKTGIELPTKIAQAQ
ncbi:MFS transporter, partial [Candidatus Aminicenantes bacterium AC-335-A11]|nr:MFS transporter [Candidatus Aminicenantes bacterium AC-335-A11]